MNLTDKDMHELHEAHRDVFLPVVETARMRARFANAAARSAAKMRADEAEHPPMYRCICGQTMTLPKWTQHGCGLCGRRPVANPLTPPRDDMGTEVPMLGHVASVMPREPELTPAERTWRAHKGFSR